jgi:hypothetical protein
LLAPLDPEALAAQRPAPGERAEELADRLRGTQRANGLEAEPAIHERKRLLLETMRGLARLAACAPETAPLDPRIQDLLIHGLTSKKVLEQFAAATAAAELGPRARPLAPYLEERGLPFFRTEDRVERFARARACLAWTENARAAQVAELADCPIEDLAEAVEAIERHDDPAECRYDLSDDVVEVLVARGLKASDAGSELETDTILDILDDTLGPKASTARIWPLVVAADRETEWLDEAPDAATIAAWIATEPSLADPEPPSCTVRMLAKVEAVGLERRAADSWTLPPATRDALLRLVDRAQTDSVRTNAIEVLVAWSDEPDPELASILDDLIASAVEKNLEARVRHLSGVRLRLALRSGD